MFNRVAYGYNWRPYNYSEFVCDSDDDIASLPTTDDKECAVGSRAYVPSAGRVYILNGNGEWSLAKSSGGGGGGTVPESSIASDDEIAEMIDDVFGDDTDQPADDAPITPQDSIDDVAVTSDEEFSEMIDDVFGGNTQNGDAPVDDDI